MHNSSLVTRLTNKLYRRHQPALPSTNVSIRDRLSSDELDWFQARLLLGLTGFLAILISAFVVLRLVQADYSQAALNALLAVVVMANGALIWRTGEARVAGTVLAIVFSLMIAYTVYRYGLWHVYVLFAGLVVNFLLVRLYVALVLNVLLAAVALAVVWAQGEPMAVMMLATGLALTLATVSIFVLSGERQYEFLHSLAHRDALTGLRNRRDMDETLTGVVASGERHGVTASLIAFDIDHFKAVNDSHGHDEGDRLLKELARLLRRTLRESDQPYRSGGEEFVVLAFETDLQQAKILAENLRTRICETLSSPNGPLTVSLGCAQWRKGESRDEWLKRADEAMYKAKTQGRNQTVLAAED